jgi:hypothetical protein
MDSWIEDVVLRVTLVARIRMTCEYACDMTETTLSI